MRPPSLLRMCFWLIAAENSGGADLSWSPECHAAGSAFDVQLPCNCLHAPRPRDGADFRAALIFSVDSASARSGRYAGALNERPVVKIILGDFIGAAVDGQILKIVIEEVGRSQ